ncbi:MAG: hypothetical protein FJ096_19715 [Deltaproteobacteria bacterium]|nr:hypothetical protein [Deltaproteobacteria bacterium]
MRVKLPERLLPDGPRWESGPVVGPLPRARLLAHPRGGVVDQMADVAERLVLGLRGADARTLWVHHGRSSYLGGRAVAGGFALCNADGEAVILDAGGRVERRFGLGRQVTRCDVTHDALARTEVPREATLLGDLAAALRHPRPEELSLQLFLVDELAALPAAGPMLRELATMPDLAEDGSAVAAARGAIRSHAKDRLRARSDVTLRR